MVIKTERLTLRPLTADDLYTAHSYAGDAENTRYMVFLPTADIAETKTYLDRVREEWEKEDRSLYEFAVVLGSDHIGSVSVELDDSRTVGEMGWILHKDFRGKGYCTEAAGAVAAFAREVLKVRELQAHCDSENIPSCRVMEKLGFTLEDSSGRRRNRMSDMDSTELKYVMKF